MWHRLSWFRRHLLLYLGLLLILMVLVVGGSLVLVHAQTQGGKAPSCGSLTLHEGVQNSYVLSPGSRSIEHCFVQAYQQCQARALNVTWMGVDAGTRSTFTIEKQGKGCQLLQSSQNYVLGHTNAPSGTTSCQGITQTSDSLILKHCGSGGDIRIPRGESCGYVSPQQTSAATKQAEACFMQDYRQCYGAELGYEPSGTLGYNFQLDFTCKLTVVVSGSQSRFSCAGLVQQADGLHALNCGKAGTIRIPSRP